MAKNCIECLNRMDCQVYRNFLRDPNALIVQVAECDKYEEDEEFIRYYNELKPFIS